MGAGRAVNRSFSHDMFKVTMIIGLVLLPFGLGQNFGPEFSIFHGQAQTPPWNNHPSTSIFNKQVIRLIRPWSFLLTFASRWQAVTCDTLFPFRGRSSVYCILDSGPRVCPFKCSIFNIYFDSQYNTNLFFLRFRDHSYVWTWFDDSRHLHPCWHVACSVCEASNWNSESGSSEVAQLGGLAMIHEEAVARKA